MPSPVEAGNQDPVYHITPEIAQVVTAQLHELGRSQNYYLDPTAFPGVYKLFDQVTDQIKDTVYGLSSRYFYGSPAFRNTIQEVSWSARFGETAEGPSDADDVNFRVGINVHYELDEHQRPVDEPMGRFVDHGDHRFDIVLHPALFERYQTPLQDVLGGEVGQLGPEVATLGVIAHELGHAIHDSDIAHEMLIMRPEWALSDSLTRARDIELERFAVGIEHEVLSDYIAQQYGANKERVRDLLDARSGKAWAGEHPIFNESSVASMTDPRGIERSSENSGYRYPLTREQLQLRLRELADVHDLTASGKQLGIWNGADKQPDSEWQHATKDAQLRSGLRKLSEGKPKTKRRKMTKRDATDSAIVAGAILAVAAVAGYGGHRTGQDSVPDRAPSHTQETEDQEGVIELRNGTKFVVGDEIYIYQDGSLVPITPEDEHTVTPKTTNVADPSQPGSIK